MGAVLPLSRREYTVEQPSDAELVEAARERGDARAKEALYFRLAPMVTRLVHRLLGGQEVHDVVQNAFVSAFQELDRLEDPALVRAWVRAVAVTKVRRVTAPTVAAAARLSG